MPASPAASPEVCSVAVSPGVPGQSACSEPIHDALKADLARWRALPVDDYWFHAGALHEMRRCPRCGSSLMRKVELVEVRYPDVGA